MTKIVATKDTVIKTSVLNSSQLGSNEKFNLYAGDSLDANWVQKDGVHLKFELKEPRNGRYCWYAYSPDISVATEPTAKVNPPQIDAFLDLIAYCEGTDRTLDTKRSGYNIMFGGGTFENYNDHPRKVIKLSGYASNASGRYQFLAQTWDECKEALNLPDFSPASQDKAGVYLLERRKATRNILEGDLVGALEKCSWEWASLPYQENKSRYGQPVFKLSECEKIYNDALKLYLPNNPIPPKKFEVGDFLPPLVNLAVPYLSQRDNELHPSTSCNTTSVAMCLLFFGKFKETNARQFEDELTRKTFQWGEDGRYWHNNLVKLFEEYGVQDKFDTKATWQEIKTHLANGKPVIYSGKFTKGGHLLVLRGYDSTGFFVNDPFGEWFSSGYQAKSGENLHYSYNLISRVSYGGNNAGWAHLVG